MNEYDDLSEHEPDNGDVHEAARNGYWRTRDPWIRGLFMLLFMFVWGLAEVVAGGVIVIQFAWLLVKGRVNDRLRDFSQSLATYCYQIALFLMLNTEDKPFPFMDWPEGPARAESDDEQFD
jgi:hypothetical protein